MDLDISVVEDAIVKRANSTIKLIKPIFENREICEVWVAGGCLSGGVINDIDIFIPPNQENFILYNWPVLSNTKNAVTYAYTKPIQICKYTKPTLAELVESFDFAHIKVGSSLKWDGLNLSLGSVYISKDFILSHATDSSWYTGSEYPLSSLIRLGKYYKRDAMGKSAYIGSVLSIVSAIVSRGFKDYSDFKDQLDAVDLGLLPEDLKDVEGDVLSILFDKLDKSK